MTDIEVRMSEDFAVFRLGTNGLPVLCDECASFQLAEMRVQVLAVSQPGEYLIVNKKDGHETSVNLDKRKVKPKKR